MKLFCFLELLKHELSFMKTLLLKLPVFLQYFIRLFIPLLNHLNNPILSLLNSLFSCFAIFNHIIIILTFSMFKIGEILLICILGLDLFDLISIMCFDKSANAYIFHHILVFQFKVVSILHVLFFFVFIIEEKELISKFLIFYAK